MEPNLGNFQILRCSWDEDIGKIKVSGKLGLLSLLEWKVALQNASRIYFDPRRPLRYYLQLINKPDVAQRRDQTQTAEGGLEFSPQRLYVLTRRERYFLPHTTSPWVIEQFTFKFKTTIINHVSLLSSLENARSLL